MNVVNVKNNLHIVQSVIKMKFLNFIKEKIILHNQNILVYQINVMMVIMLIQIIFAKYVNNCTI